MTDVPRRSYPLVVSPPGGFEDAVKRGRRLRRRRTGGGAGAALALAGLLAYTGLGDSANPRSIDVADSPDPTRQPSYAPGASESPSPEPSVTPTSTTPPPSADPGTPVGPGEAPGPTDEPSLPGEPPETTRPPREDGNPKVYAKRSPITEGPAEATTSTPCPPELGRIWCAYARVTTPSETGTARYELQYTLCRQVDAGDGWVQFDRVQEADFSATEDARQDTVWTYSAGQPVVPVSSRTEIPAGNCVTWSTMWDGYDDYGYTPPAGFYTLRARSTGTSDTTLPTATYAFDHA